MKSFAVIGLGRFGTEIAEKLHEYGGEVLAIDRDERLVDRIADRVTRAVVADAQNKDVLQGLGVADCDTAIVAIASDLEASILSTMNLKALGVPQVICKAHDDTHREILEKIGADRVIIPERMVADKLSRSLISPSLLEYIDLSEDCGIVERVTPQRFCGQSIRALNVRARYGVNIIAIRRGEKIHITLDPDEVLSEEDVLVLLGSHEALEKIEKMKA